MEEIEILKNSSEDLVWFLKNLALLKKSYAGKVIAIRNKSVLASASNIKSLLKELSTRGIEDSEVLIKQVGSGKEVVIYSK